MFHSSLRRNECLRQGPLFLLPGSRLLREGRCLSWVVRDALAVRRSRCLPWTPVVFNLLLTEVSSICGVLLVFCVQENDSIHVSLFRCFPHFKLLWDIVCSSVLYGKPFLSVLGIVMCTWTSLGAQVVKYPPALQELQVQSRGQEDPLEKGMATLVSLPGEFHG